MWKFLIGLGALVLVILVAGYVLSFAGKRPGDLGVQSDGRLKPVPASPNAVSSDAPQADSHHINPLPAKPFAEVITAIRKLPRWHIVESTDDYLHAEHTSLIFRFVDDIELHHRGDHIAVRSASRVGHSDLGANRARVEMLRELLSE